MRSAVTPVRRWRACAGSGVDIDGSISSGMDLCDGALHNKVFHSTQTTQVALDFHTTADHATALGPPARATPEPS